MLESGAVTKGNLKGLDLNLLLPLYALLEHRGVSRAAESLGSSQPALSRVLARLRHHLGDPLLVRSGPGMRLTERAESLRQPVRMALSQLDAIFSDSSTFDPALVSKTYQIAASECHQLIFLPALFARLKERSPLLKLAVEVPRTDDLDRLSSGALDFLIGPTTRAHESLHSRLVSEETFCCVLGSCHSAAFERMSIETYCGLKHAVLEDEKLGCGGCLADEVLRTEGREREVVLRASSFLAMAEVLLHSQLVATVSSRYAGVAMKLGLCAVKAPEVLRSQRIYLLWHPSRQDDVAHQWLRTQIGELDAPC